MPDDLAPEYKRTVVQMMESQAYRELAAAQMFGYGLQFVPALKWLKFIAWHITEEMQHYELVARMYQEFTSASVEPIVNARLTEKPIPFAQSWFELAMAQFLYDRGGFFARVLADLRAALQRLGSRRVTRGNLRYWDLKPDYKPGEVFTV